MRAAMVILFGLCGLLALGAAHASDDGRLHFLDREAIDTPVFLKHHPDLRWRFDALGELEKGNRTIAFRHFLQAARYGDKLSQAMVAEMYWLGSGTEPNRALGYAWMDLAAERMYVPLLVKREQYWRAMSEAEQARALEVGEEVYAEYGDDVALPRLQLLIDRGKRGATGSRAGSRGGARVITGASGLKFQPNCGFDGPVKVCLGFAAMGAETRIVRMWDPHFWEMKQYLAWKETELDFELTGKARVDVMPIQTVDTEVID